MQRKRTESNPPSLARLSSSALSRRKRQDASWKGGPGIKCRSWWLFPDGAIGCSLQERNRDSIANGYWHARRLTFLTPIGSSPKKWLNAILKAEVRKAASATTPRHGLEHYCRDLNSWPRSWMNLEKDLPPAIRKRNAASLARASAYAIFISRGFRTPLFQSSNACQELRSLDGLPETVSNDFLSGVKRPV
jgi:hypothetical protein